jgi:hypothetical protein
MQATSQILDSEHGVTCEVCHATGHLTIAHEAGCPFGTGFAGWRQLGAVGYALHVMATHGTTNGRTVLGFADYHVHRLAGAWIVDDVVHAAEGAGVLVRHAHGGAVGFSAVTGVDLPVPLHLLARSRKGAR